MTEHTRRTMLKAAGAAAAFGGIGATTAAARPDGDLRLVSEQPVSGALEAVTQGNYVYVATGSGLAVVDWRNPNRPELVGEMTAADPAAGILDVKVDGDLAALASNEGPGITLVDVSDPTDPQELSFFEGGFHVHNLYLYDDHAYLTINESDENAFSEARTDVVDVSDPTAPEKVGEYRLKDDFPEFAAGGVSPNHDVYVQNDLLYQAFWDAGVVVADVSDPTAPQLVTQFGDAPEADTPQGDEFPLERYLTRPGNAHYVQPSPDGQYVYVGNETFPGSFVDNPDNDDYGGIIVWDVSDVDDPQRLTRIEPPSVEGFRTSHNFDVTANRLHTSWYDGGIVTFDVTDPADPDRLRSYYAEGSSFWTAVTARSYTIGSDIGGGLVFLSSDSGEARGPDFEGGERPDDPGMGAPDE